MAAARKAYTPAQFETEVDRRLDIKLQERAEKVWSVTVNGHLAELTADVKDVKDMLQTHINQPYHAGTKALLDQVTTMAAAFGVETLNQEERAAFPGMVKDWVQHARTAVAVEKAATARWQKLTAWAAAAAVVVALASAIGIFAWVRIHLLGVGP